MSQIPDVEYIKAKVPIMAVADALGIRIAGKFQAHCWRLEAHRRGDAGPSFRFHKKTNKGRCFVCDAHIMSNIDLVMLYRTLEFREAVAWIAGTFPVPDIPRGAHVKKRKDWSPQFRASDADGVIALLIRGHLWRDLSPAEQSILAVLENFKDESTGYCRISYVGIMHYSGVNSSATVAAALKHFRQMGLLENVSPNVAGALRPSGKYRFTPDNNEFQALLRNTYQREKAVQEVQKGMREQARRARAKAGGRGQAPV